MIPLAAVLGPWCVPGAPACAFALDEETVWFESTNTSRPWTFEGGVLTLDPGGDLERTLEVLHAGERWLQARPPGGEPSWFYREAADLPPELLDGRQERWAEVAEPARPSPWRLSDALDWNEGLYLSPAGGPQTVVEHAPDALRLVGEWYSVRMAIWVQADGFDEQLIRDTTIAPGVTALSGARLTQLGPADDGLVPVQIDDATWSFTGVAPAESLGIAWRPGEEVEGRPRPGTDEPLVLYQSAAGDQVIGTFEPDARGWWLEERGESPRGDRITAVIRTEALRLEGWVEARLLDVAPSERLVISASGEGSWGASHSSVVHVEPGSPLYAGDAVVGVALEGALLRVGWGAEPVGARLPVTLHTPWGSTSLELDCLRLEPVAPGVTRSALRCAP